MSIKSIWLIIVAIMFLTLFGWFKNIYNILNHYPDKIGDFEVSHSVCAVGVLAAPVGSFCGIFNIGVKN